jgi:hypothetical protein
MTKGTPWPSVTIVCLLRREEALIRGLLAKLGVAVPARPPEPVAAAAAAHQPVERPRGLDG